MRWLRCGCCSSLSRAMRLIKWMWLWIYLLIHKTLKLLLTLSQQIFLVVFTDVITLSNILSWIVKLSILKHLIWRLQNIYVLRIDWIISLLHLLFFFKKIYFYLTHTFNVYIFRFRIVLTDLARCIKRNRLIWFRDLVWIAHLGYFLDVFSEHF